MNEFRIAIIGGGNVGGTLARRFLSAGLDVVLGVRNPEDPKYAGAHPLTLELAVASAEVVLLATPWSATESVLQQLGSSLDGKILVDATNPIASDFKDLTHSGRDSGGLQVARWAPGAKVVKAFNTIGYNIMDNPSLGGVPTSLLIAGDDAFAKEIVSDLASRIGFSPVDVGGLERSEQTEAMAWLWITMAMRIGREFAFNFHKP